MSRSHRLDSGVQVVWFKRDLRVRDHRPLLEACARGPVLALYCFEPSLMREPGLEEESQRVFERQGSRRRPAQRRKANRETRPSAQLALFD